MFLQGVPVDAEQHLLHGQHTGGEDAKARRPSWALLPVVVTSAAALAIVGWWRQPVAEAPTLLNSAPGQCNSPFPAGFRWSVATAAYQVEGAVTATNRTPSIWDDFCTKAATCPGVGQTLDVVEGCTPLACADVADDMFHRYKEDIAAMSRLHVTSYRMSISWSRLMTWDSVQRRMVANPAGVAFYRELLYELRRWYIEPMVTLYHWDMPLALEQELQPSAWLNRDIVDHFRDFAELAFTEFGQLVPLWFTINEPWTFTRLGYTLGSHAPGRKGSPTETYTAGHHVLLAHASAVSVYRTMRAEGSHVMPNGRVSIVVNSDFGVPRNPQHQADVDDALAFNEFVLDWWLSPLAHGRYPDSMIERAGSNLPVFTAEESALVKGSLDGVIGLNHYTTHVVTTCSSPESTTNCSSHPPGWDQDLAVDLNGYPDGARMAASPECAWLRGWPVGYGQLLDYVHARYPELSILLTENGWCGANTVDDEDQLWYYQHYVAEVLQAINRGVPIIGYTAWSLMDNYEWGTFVPRFGLWHVDYDTLERTPKTAALWFSQVMGSNCLLP